MRVEEKVKISIEEMGKQEETQAIEPTTMMMPPSWMVHIAISRSAKVFSKLCPPSMENIRMAGRPLAAK